MFLSLPPPPEESSFHKTTKSSPLYRLAYVALLDIKRHLGLTKTYLNV